jgi:chromosome undetermined scaffold_166, whole genome shotgun sequence
MNQELVARVKEYNKNYKLAMADLNKSTAQINVYEQEIDKLCKELSEVMGVPVTMDNALELYQAKCKEIENNLQIGEEIISRLNSPVEEPQQPQVQQHPVQQQPVQQPQVQQPVQQPQAPVQDLSAPLGEPLNTGSATNKVEDDDDFDSIGSNSFNTDVDDI